jgi:hypothetical protein
MVTIGTIGTVTEGGLGEAVPMSTIVEVVQDMKHVDDRTILVRSSEDVSWKGTAC